MKKPKKGYHRHHIIPKHAGGTNDDTNICYLTVEEHIAEHRRLYAKYGKQADLAAANLLHASLYLNYDEVAQKLFSDMARRGAEKAHIVKQNNGFYKRLGKSNSEKLRGRVRPDLSEAQSQKWKERPLIWCNNGTIDKRLPVCPDGWVEGRLFHHDEKTKHIVSEKMSATRWWTDGKINKRSEHQPSPEFILGRTNRKNHAKV